MDSTTAVPNGSYIVPSPSTASNTAMAMVSGSGDNSFNQIHSREGEDYQLRMLSSSAVWMLNPKVFYRVAEKLGPCSVDLIQSHLPWPQMLYRYHGWSFSLGSSPPSCQEGLASSTQNPK